MYHAPFRITEPRDPVVVVELEPVKNALLMMMLVGSSSAVRHPALAQAAQTTTSEERHRNRLVFEGLGEAITPADADADIDAYLDALASADPRALRDRIVGCFADMGTIEIDPAILLADRELFVRHVMRAYGPEQADRTLFADVHALLNDPPALRDLVVGHLRAMWERVAPAWRWHVATLRNDVRTLRIRLAGATMPDAVRIVLNDALPATLRLQFEGLERLVIVPSLVTGPLALRFGSRATLWLFVPPQGSRHTASRPPAKRGELLGPLAALADDTRLHILELLATEGPLLAQELLGRLDISQPTLSRHLKQLAGTGFVVEQRGGGANKRYEYNPATLEWTFRALEQVFAGKAATEQSSDVRDAYPELRRFLDAEGRIVLWPTKQSDQHRLHLYLATKFEDGREYTERDVNDVLQRWSEACDHVTLRRDLYDKHLLERTLNGARYWKGQGTDER